MTRKERPRNEQRALGNSLEIFDASLKDKMRLETKNQSHNALCPFQMPSSHALSRRKEQDH